MIIALIFSVAVFSQNGQYTLGHPSSGGSSANLSASGHNGVTPFTSSKKNSRSQYFYLADELISQSATPGTITALSFNVLQIPAGATPMDNITISIGTTTSSSFTASMPAAGTFAVHKTISSLEIAETGWITFDLDTDFYWNGTDNIIVEICKNDDSAIGTNFKVQTTHFASERTRALFTTSNSGSAAITGCNMTSASTSSNVSTISPSLNRRYRPDVRFTFACSGTPSPAGSVVDINPGVRCYGESISLKVQGGSKASRLSYQWESSASASSETFVPIAGATSETLTVTQLASDVYYRRKTGCGGNSIDSGALLVSGLNTWNGTSWSMGTPTDSQSVVIAGNYTLDSNRQFCSLIVNSGTVTVNPGVTLTVDNEIRVNGGSLVFENSASLIQNNPSAVNFGNITYKRSSQPVRRYDFTYWSSPVQPQSLGNFSPLTLSDKYMAWNSSAGNWNIESPSAFMSAGKGYIIRAPQTFATTGSGTVFTGSFFGVPNNGQFQTPVSGSGSWNLIGNPYPSGLDAISFLSDPANAGLVDGTIFLWTHNTSPSAGIPGDNTYNYTSNDYAMFNFTGGVGGTASAASTTGNTAEPNGFIGAGQSFMIKGLNAGGMATFKNDMRIGEENLQFFRQAEASELTTIERSRIWLEISNQQGNFKQALLGYVTGASNELDRGYDGTVMDGANISLYTIALGEHLGIQGRSLPFDTSDTVLLGFKASVAGNHKISMYKSDGIFESQHVYLHDTQLGIIHNFKHGSYNFSTTSGTFDNRFVILFTNEPAQVKAPTAFSAFNANGAIHIDAGAETLESICVYDLAGRKLLSKTGTGSTAVIDSKQWATEILMLRVTTKNNVFVKKLAN